MHGATMKYILRKSMKIPLMFVFHVKLELYRIREDQNDIKSAE
jgi:predicted RNA methylase